MRFFLILLLFILINCSSNLSHNKVAVGYADLPGGRSGDLSWEDTLTFKRFSWYRGVTLSYDALIYRVETNSKFINWFSKDERDLLNKCKDLIITIKYSAFHSSIKHSDFNIHMLKKGFQRVTITRFANSVRAHPAFETWNLQQYKVRGYCNKTQKLSYFVIDFPSFPEATVKF